MANEVQRMLERQMRITEAEVEPDDVLHRNSDVSERMATLDPGRVLRRGFDASKCRPESGLLKPKKLLKSTEAVEVVNSQRTCINTKELVGKFLFLLVMMVLLLAALILFI